MTGIVVTAPIWLMVSLVTSALMLWELRLILRDRTFIARMKWNGGMRTVVDRDLRVASVRMAMALSYVISGTVLLISPDSPPTRVLFTTMLIGTALGLLVNALLERRGRHALAISEGHRGEYLPSALRVPPVTEPPPDDAPDDAHDQIIHNYTVAPDDIPF